MRFNECMKCESIDYEIKSASISTKSNMSLITITKKELYYIKTCINCGYTEIYDAKIVDRYAHKKRSNVKG